MSNSIYLKNQLRSKRKQKKWHQDKCGVNSHMMYDLLCLLAESSERQCEKLSDIEKNISNINKQSKDILSTITCIQKKMEYLLCTVVFSTVLSVGIFFRYIFSR